MQAAVAVVLAGAMLAACGGPAGLPAGATAPPSGLEWTTISADDFASALDDQATGFARRHAGDAFEVRVEGSGGQVLSTTRVNAEGASLMTVHAEDGTWVTACTAPQVTDGISCFQRRGESGPWEFIADRQAGAGAYQDWDRVGWYLGAMLASARAVVEAARGGLTVEFARAEQDGVAYLRSSRALGDGITSGVVLAFQGDRVFRFDSWQDPSRGPSAGERAVVTIVEDEPVEFPPVSEQVIIDRSGPTPVARPRPAS